MYYLAVDIGASSGRVMLGTIVNGKIKVEELHRFQNGAVLKNGHLCWEIQKLFAEIKIGMRKCGERNIQPESMAVDCFGVDFALLDENGNLLGDTVSYRDARTEGMMEKSPVSPDALYKRTGMLGGNISSVFQLLALKEEDGLCGAARFLHLPDYINFLLTGRMENEYSISQTSMLVSAEKEDFDGELLDAFGISKGLFKKPLPPGTNLGKVRPEIFAETGINPSVILAASHDTVSAALAVPYKEDCIFISSGTWSMLGTYTDAPLLWDGDVRYNNMFITKGHYGLIYGIQGLYLITAVKRETEDKYSYDDLAALAESSSYKGVIDVNDPSLSAPESMAETVKNLCRKAGLPVPETLGDVLSCIYHSLAEKYREEILRIEEKTGKTYDKIFIVGGGSRDTFLNALTEKVTGKKVHAGPSEATAIGNVAAQGYAAGVFKTLWDVKDAIE